MWLRQVGKNDIHEPYFAQYDEYGEQIYILTSLEHFQIMIDISYKFKVLVLKY